MHNFKFHQGDVQGAIIPKLPQGAKKVENKPVAYGEHSGHCHILTGNVELFEIEGRTFAVVGSEGATLQHTHESMIQAKSWQSKELLPMADHKTLPLQEGVYEFWIQNSYNPYSKLFEKVID